MIASASGSPSVPASILRCLLGDPKGGSMSIKWRHDVDQVLTDAKAQKRPVLLDFSAAPM